MTPAQAKTLLPVLTAYSEGKEVQWRIKEASGYWERWETGKWRDCAVMNSGQAYEPSLTDPKLEWRIKPTPRTGRMCLTCQSHFHIHNSEQIHNQHCRKPDVVQWVEVVP